MLERRNSRTVKNREDRAKNIREGRTKIKEPQNETNTKSLLIEDAVKELKSKTKLIPQQLDIYKLKKKKRKKDEIHTHSGLPAVY